MQKGVIWWTLNQCVFCKEFESENVITKKMIANWKNLGGTKFTSHC